MQMETNTFSNNELPKITFQIHTIHYYITEALSKKCESKRTDNDSFIYWLIYLYVYMYVKKPTSPKAVQINWDQNTGKNGNQQLA